MTPNLEKIYNTAFDLIELRLNKKEQVYPFAIHLSDKVEKPVVSMSGMHPSDTKETVKFLQEEMRTLSAKGDVSALCVCYNMSITDPRNNEVTDAVLIELADKNSTKNIYVPYSFKDEEIIKKPFEVSSKEFYF